MASDPSLKILARKKNGKVMIGIPSLPELEDDSEKKESRKLPMAIQKGQSKLFAKLPAPRNSGYKEQKERLIVHAAFATSQVYNMAGMVNSGMPQPTYLHHMKLDNAALGALHGTAGLKRKLPDDAQIIDIKQAKLTYDPSLSYVKAISEEQTASTGEKFMYNKLQKKKHQITWLAAEAKAREVELKNQWAANRNTRKQARATYGF